MNGGAHTKGDMMSPHRFNECLHHIRWTPINLAATFQCDRSWIEAWETGSEEVPAGLLVGRIDALNNMPRPNAPARFDHRNEPSLSLYSRLLLG